MTVEILPLPVTMLDDYWPHIRPVIAKGIEVCGRPKHQLGEDIIFDRVRVWFATTDEPRRRILAAWLTEVVEDNGRCLMVFGMGGEQPAAWVDAARERMEQYGRDEKCRAARYAGRKGWSRMLPDYKPTISGDVTVYERAIA